MRLLACSPTIRNCIISDNNASIQGGGAYIENSSALIDACTFTSNDAYYEGAGVYLQGGDATLTNCIISDNDSPKGAGVGVTLNSTNALLVDTVISGNTANGDLGGGVYSHNGDQSYFLRCVITGNSATSSPGGFYCSGTPSLEATLVCGNSESQDSGNYINVNNSSIFTSICPSLGACCVSDCGSLGQCLDDVYQIQCDNLGGEWTDGASCADINCGPVQWTIEDGGNGHWYQLVEKVGGWNACRDAAIAVGGDLCSHDTQLEDEFISQLVPLEEPGIAWNRVYTGATQAEGSNPTEGWSWIDGSPWTDTNWHSNQPNGGEGYLSVSNQIDEGFGWDDHDEDSSDINFYLIEWSTDCNDDGIVDYGQILDGTLLDLDCNGTPDNCLAPTNSCCIDLCVGTTLCFEDLDESECTDLGGTFNAIQTCSETACGAVQWTEGDDALGHWYTGIVQNDPIFSWTAMQAAAQNIGGTLATPVTDAENDFIYDNIASRPELWDFSAGGGHGPALGGIRTGDNINEDWEWLTGEPWDWTNWGCDQPSGEDNADNDEPYLHYYSCTGPQPEKIWNDLRNLYSGNSIVGYIVEWGADCDGDGMVDIEQIALGLATDADCNGIPDECLPPAGTGACCTGLDICVITNSVDCTGFYFEQQTCDQIDCFDKVTVDGNGIDDPANGQFTSIQGAIDASYDGMTISVMAGTYPGDGDSVITLPAHGITMTGIGGAENTIINAQSQRRGLIGDGCGDNGTVIQGLTFTNGYADNGGGILLNDCSVELRDCIIIANNATDNGGGIDACGAGIVIDSCSFSENNCTNHGGAIHSNCGIDLLITNCDFTLNTTDDEVGVGAGIALLGTSADVSDCTFSNNQAAACGAVYLRDASITTWTDCQFNQNHASWRTGAFGMTSDSAEEGCVTTLTRCVFTQNSTSAHVPSTFFNGDFETTLIDDCTFTDNGSPGPCLRNSGGTLLTIRDTLMCGNSGGNIDENYDPYTDDGGNTIEETCPPLGACCVGDCDATSICYDDLYDFECSELGGTFNDGLSCGDAGCGAV
ncbi:MAG: hypothetical protein P8L37_08405, partial [Phycisphaerales bacterium]|nr:hypothetical protein [Phycisphaerales bacterium]